MSLLLPDFLSRLVATRLTIALGNDGIAIVLSKGFNKNNILHQQFVPNEKSDWQSLVKQLDVSLGQLKLPGNTVCTFVLSSDFVRYLILPAQPFAMNAAERTAYIEAAYRDIYGRVTDAWYIKCDDVAPSQNMLAVAVDTQLMTALSQLAVQHAFKLHSVQPYLMAAFNGLIPQVARKNGYLVLIEQSKLLLIRLGNGKCQHLRTLSFSHNWQLDLQQAIQRESALNEELLATDKQLYIYAPAQKNTLMSEIKGWDVKKIGLRNSLPNAAYAMLEAVL